MLKVGKNHDKLRVVNDQIGTPTYTYDLARTPIPYVNETLSINLTNKVKANLGIK